MPHRTGATTMAPVSLYRRCHGQPHAGCHPCLCSAFTQGGVGTPRRHGNPVLATLAWHCRCLLTVRRVAGGVSPQGLGAWEETLVPGRQQALLSSTCHEETEKGPVGQRRDPERRGMSLVRRPKRSTGPNLQEGGGGRNHAGSNRRRQSYASKGWWQEGTPTCALIWLPDPGACPGPCRRPQERTSGKLTYPYGRGAWGRRRGRGSTLVCGICPGGFHRPYPADSWQPRATPVPAVTSHSARRAAR